MRPLVKAGLKEYSDCFEQTVPKENLKEEYRLDSERAFRFHFDRSSYWGGRVVDFGGSIGAKTRMIRNVTVVEVDKSAQRWMRQNNVKFADSLDCFNDNSVDTIYCSHVLEHLEVPMDYLRSFRRKLKPGGRLIIALPAEEQTFEFRKNMSARTDHLQTWGFLHINRMLERAGFRVKNHKLNVFPLVVHGLFCKNVFYVNLLYSLSRSKPARLAIYIYNRIWLTIKEIAIILIESAIGKDIYYQPSTGELPILAEKVGAK